MQHYFIATAKANQGKTKHAVFTSAPEKSYATAYNDVVARLSKQKMTLAELSVNRITPREAQLVRRITDAKKRINLSTQELIRLSRPDELTTIAANKRGARQAITVPARKRVKKLARLNRRVKAKKV